MAINKLHPDYPKYIEKCKALSAAEIEEENAAREKYPDWNGLDHPAGTQLKEIYSRYSAA